VTVTDLSLSQDSQTRLRHWWYTGQR